VTLLPEASFVKPLFVPLVLWQIPNGIKAPFESGGAILLKMAGRFNAGGA